MSGLLVAHAVGGGLMTVFVSIASYRDSELVPTVFDGVAQAASPDDLRVVVCWQHAPDEDAAALREDPRVELIDVDYRDSRGACWAAELTRPVRARFIGGRTGADHEAAGRAWPSSRSSPSSARAVAEERRRASSRPAGRAPRTAT